MQPVLERYELGGKTFLVGDLNMERVTVRKVDRIVRQLPPQKREIFMRLFSAISSALDWERYSKYVVASLQNLTPDAHKFSYYQMQRKVNALLRNARNWVLRNESFPENKIVERAIGLALSARSICRFFDEQATCWKADLERFVQDDVQQNATH